MTDDTYKYILTYTHNDVTIKSEFPADISIFEMEPKLREFLSYCSFNEENIDKILKKEYKPDVRNHN